MPQARQTVKALALVVPGNKESARGGETKTPKPRRGGLGEA